MGAEPNRASVRDRVVAHEDQRLADVHGRDVEPALCRIVPDGADVTGSMRPPELGIDEVLALQALGVVIVRFVDSDVRAIGGAARNGR